MLRKGGSEARARRIEAIVPRSCTLSFVQPGRSDEACHGVSVAPFAGLFAEVIPLMRPRWRRRDRSIHLRMRAKNVADCLRASPCQLSINRGNPIPLTAGLVRPGLPSLWRITTSQPTSSVDVREGKGHTQRRDIFIFPWKNRVTLRLGANEVLDAGSRGGFVRHWVLVVLTRAGFLNRGKLWLLAWDEVLGRWKPLRSCKDAKICPCKRDSRRGKDASIR